METAKATRVSSSARRATAFHEAGHAVAARDRGFRLHRATIVPSGDYAGIVEHSNPLRGIDLGSDRSPLARLRAEDAIIVHLAGPAAQRRYKPRSYRSYHGKIDYERALGLAVAQNGPFEAAKAQLRWLEIVARDMIEQQWHFVESVAEALLEKGTLSGAQLRRVLSNGG